MDIKLTLALPRDELSVPVVRRVLKAAMQVLGVRADLISDIELALTEAVTNVLDHADGHEEYEVSAGIDDQRCVIEVTDRGRGFQGEHHGLALAEQSAESGRGIQLMRALVDQVQFAPKSADGTVVRLEKALSFDEQSAVRRFTGQAGGDVPRR